MRALSSRSAAPDDKAFALVENRPFALVEKVRGAMRIAALDPHAVSLGLSPGLALADARARVPELMVFDADPGADLRWLERVADHCERYTPMVALDAPDGITLDITGCAHLFGGETKLVADMENRMQRGMQGTTGHLRHAFADTPEGAQALARFQTVPAASEDTALRRLPIAALRLEPETETALRRAGLRTIGDLATRPSAPIAARFGEEATDMLARVLGQTDSRIVPRRALPALYFERRFAEPIARTEDALAVIGELGAEAASVLEERRKGGRRFTARLYRSDGQIRDLHVESGLPLRDPALLVKLFSERVEALADPIDPGFGFDMIRFAIPSLEPMMPTQLQLEGGTVTQEAMAALVDRLSTRLGRDRIHRFAPRDTHIPEQGVLTLPAVDAPAPAIWEKPQAGEPPLRPLHLFDPPQKIEVMAEVPDGPPHRFRWRRTLHDVTRFEGPERIAAEWWKRPEGTGITRDYYRVEDARGRRFWIFRHGLYGTEKENPVWYVHGLFA